MVGFETRLRPGTRAKDGQQDSAAVPKRTAKPPLTELISGQMLFIGRVDLWVSINREEVGFRTSRVLCQEKNSALDLFASHKNQFFESGRTARISTTRPDLSAG
jgi:hypothetical protein